MDSRELSKQKMDYTNGWLCQSIFLMLLSSFMRFMEQVFKPFIGKFLIVYCNDILIFTKDSDSHITHLRTVFELLRQYQLYVIPKYSLFGASRVKFLGFIVSDKHIQIDPVTILAITNYPIPKSLADLRYFHGLVTFCKRFIKKCNIVTAPITECLKTKSYTWNSQVEESFQEIKRRIASAPILSLPDADKTFRIDFDATKDGVGAILSQEGCLIAYFSKKLNGAQQNYAIDDLKFYAIVQALKFWKHHLIGKEFILRSDILWFHSSQRKSDRKHAKWAALL